MYLVEVIYEHLVLRTLESGQQVRDLELASVIYEFEDRKTANREMGKILKGGLELKGGSILKQVIPANSIKQTAIIDFDKYVEENKLMQEDQEAQAAEGSS